MILFIWTTTLILVGFYVWRLILRIYWGTVDRKNEEGVTNKVVVITGANNGIGKCTAIEMAERGANVVMGCRNIEAALAAGLEIRKKTKNGKLFPMKLDLASFESIREFVAEVCEKFDKINILINNAAVMNWDEPNLKTKDGFEIHMGVNHLGHFLLTNLLIEPIKKASQSRIVTVSSFVHEYGQIDFDDLMGEKLQSTNVFHNKLYQNSKLANALFSQELGKKLFAANVQAYCVCPGIVTSKLSRIPWYWKPAYQLFLFFCMKTPQQGCQAILHCALNKDIKCYTGEMFHHCRKWEPEDRITLGNLEAMKLWKISEELTGITRPKYSHPVFL